MEPGEQLKLAPITEAERDALVAFINAINGIPRRFFLRIDEDDHTLTLYRKTELGGTGVVTIRNRNLVRD